MRKITSILFFFVVVGSVSAQIEQALPSTLMSKLHKKFLNYRTGIKADISWLIADLKFKDGKVKICEFGEGTRSRYKGHDAMHGKGTMWKFFWDYLKQFNLPPYYIGPAIFSVDDRREIRFEQLSELGGKTMYRTADLAHVAPFKSHKRKNNCLTLADHTGLLMFRHIDASGASILDFKNRNRDLLVLNAAVAPFVNSKYLTNILFLEEEFAPYKPKFVLCSKEYSSDLAEKIHKKLDCQRYVIKPLYEFKGRGIIMADQEDLDTVLQCMLDKNSLQEEKNKKMYASDRELFDFWHKSKKQHFLVEEYCPSNIMTIKDSVYDPTMRLVFTLHYDQGQVHITYLDAFWKIPTRSLDRTNCSLTQRCKSKGTIPAMVSDDDYRAVKAQFDAFMPSLYKKMIDLINGDVTL
ncbi:YheC/YheD family protein [Candidatus Babeliales bacterium]|nr:YheC/YheD family protein [Candidatus Babeliales bacterium]